LRKVNVKCVKTRAQICLFDTHISHVINDTIYTVTIYSAHVLLLILYTYI